MPKFRTYSNDPRPWVGVGTALEDVFTSKDALKMAGLDWKVELVPVEANRDGVRVMHPERRDVVRMDKWPDPASLLSIVSTRYKVLQNDEAFSFFDEVVSAKVDGEFAAMYHHAASLNGGRLVFILAKLPSYVVVKDVDLIEQYIMLSNSHDGTKQIRMGYLPWLATRQTVLRSGLPGRYNVAIRHAGANFNGRIAEARRALGIIKSWSDSSMVLYSKMVDTPLEEAEIDKYLKAVFPDKDKEEKSAEDRNAVLSMMKQSAQNMPEIAGSVWDLYTATTSHLQNGGNAVTGERKLNSVLFSTKGRKVETCTRLAAKLVGL